uniref:Uncharacterized protein n=1 Tax=Megaselia scalaris TaxID=36166 RepID=T1GTW5_MEGSC
MPQVANVIPILMKQLAINARGNVSTHVMLLRVWNVSSLEFALVLIRL